MKKLELTFLVIVLTVLSSGAKAQDAEVTPVFPAVEPAAVPVEEAVADPGFSLTGYVDAYFQGNLIKGKDSDNPLVFPTSFTDFANTFGIGNVNLLASKEWGKVSFVGQVGFGPRAVAGNGDSNIDFFGAGDPGLNISSTIQQLYVAYSPSDVVTLTLGNFGTFVGYEVIDANVNANYSMSYLFSNGPFFHTGLKANFAIAEGFGAMVGVFNDTDSKFDVIEGKHLGGQLSFETGGLAAYLNFLTGKEAEGDKPDDTTDDLYETQIDLTATYTVSETLLLGLNASRYATSVDGTGTGGFFGTALYSTIGVTEGFGLGLRAEYFVLTNPENIDTDEPNVLSFTASGNIKIGDLTIIPEFRYDTGNNGFLFDSNPEDTGAASFILAGVYSF
jgi:hypothetical protein